MRILATPRNQQAETQADELTAELSAFYWRAYDKRLAEIGFFSIARQLRRAHRAGGPAWLGG